MVLRLIVFVLVYGALALAGAAGMYFAGRRLLRQPLERRRRRQLGERNARVAGDGEASEEVCFACLESTDPRVDCYDRRRGWYHSRCFRQLLGSGGEP